MDGLLMDNPDELDTARMAMVIRRTGIQWQNSFNAIETCGKAVIACTHSACIGGGIEMISAADIRFCTKDAFYQMAEINIGDWLSPF